MSSCYYILPGEYCMAVDKNLLLFVFFFFVAFRIEKKRNAKLVYNFPVWPLHT